MISKTQFARLITEYRDFNNYFDKLYELKIDVLDSPLHEYPCKLFDNVIDMFFDENGTDWIDYFLYENPEHRYWVDEKEYPLATTDDLWELVKDYRI